VGAMGIGMPSAVAAGLRLPGRQIVTFIGDGSFLMMGTELATAIQYGVPVKVFISDNSSYGTIRLNQEKAYPGRSIATDLVNPDFAMMARSFGAHALKVARDQDVEAAVAEALAHDGPVVVAVKTSLRALSAYVTLDELAPAQAG
jgi:acetolactate synthase I/II/III large subunit